MGHNLKPRRNSSKLVNRFVIAVTLLVGAIGIGSGLWTLFQSVRCERWPTTEGVIKQASIRPFGKRSEASISYNYQVAGIPYTSTRLAFGEDMNRGERVVQRYPVGKNVSVHYSPHKPQEAVLETGHGGRWTPLGVGTFFVGFGWMFLYFEKVQARRVKSNEKPTN